VLRKRDAVKPGGLVVLRHYYRIKPRLGDFKLARRTKLGDDVIALFVREDAASAPPGPGEAAAGAAKAPKARLPRAPRSPKMRP